MLEDHLKSEGYDIPVLGYIPQDEAFCLESRHLGLVTPQEILSSERTDDKGRKYCDRDG